MLVTNEFLEKGRSDSGGYNRKQLELLGVAWPPLKGWKKAIIGTNIGDDVAEMFISLTGRTLKSEGRSD